MSPGSITEITEIACEGSTTPLTTTAVVGGAGPELAQVVRHDAEPVIRMRSG